MDWQSITIMALGYALACSIAYRAGVRYGWHKALGTVIDLAEIISDEDGGTDAE